MAEIKWGLHTIVSDECSTSEIYGQLWPRGGDKRPGATEVIAYSPSSPGDWVADAPTTMQEAIDRIAAALASIIGSPIP